MEPTGMVKRTRAVLQKHEGECSYRDPKTGVKCTSRYQIQIDHIRPRALGGTHAPENLRLLCRQHNLYEAERIFGREKVPRK
jgi:5-methylcytosine-specific restriction endonuclease McrA